MVLKKNDLYVFQEIRGKFVILNSETGDYFGLNAVGSAFLNLVDGKLDIDAIISELMKMYEIDEATLRRDITELTEALMRKGILTETKE
jgi:hypothetical protein